MSLLFLTSVGGYAVQGTIKHTDLNEIAKGLWEAVWSWALDLMSGDLHFFTNSFTDLLCDLRAVILRGIFKTTEVKHKSHWLSMELIHLRDLDGFEYSTLHPSFCLISLLC